MVILKDINLVPKSAISRKHKTESIRLTLLSLSILIIVLLVVDGGLLFAKSSKSKNIDKQKVTIDTLQSADVNEDVLKTVTGKIQYREDVVKKVESSQIKMSDFLISLEQLVPKDASLLKLGVDQGGAVIIQGRADKEESVLDFYHSLKVSDLSDYIEFNKITGTIGDASKGFEFQFTFKLKTGSDNK